MNIAQNVERSRLRFPNKPALVYEGRSYTYMALDELANRVANSLQTLGIRKGDRVALFLPNLPEFVFAYLGILKLGAIAVSINATLRREEVKFILEDSGAAAIFTTAALRAELPEQELSTLRYIVIVDADKHDNLTLNELLTNAASHARAVEMERDDPAAIVYTSGTTGFPKGATLSHGNVVSNMQAKTYYCGMKPADRILLFVPLFHCFGQNAVMNSGLNAGATLVLQRGFDPDRVLHSINEHKISMFFGVPTTYILLAERATVEQMQPIRYYFSAAAPLPLETARQWHEKHKLPIHQGYGLTETSPFASYNHHLAYKFGSIGMPIDGVAMEVRNLEDDQAVAPGQLGEIVIRGPNVMLGYWNRPAETAKVIQNGWFHTGDIGMVDEQGYFFIVDRVKDMINVGGMKVYPSEVENVLYQHPAVAEAAVFGAPDAIMGERVKAHIVLKPGQTLSEAELIATCRRRIASFKAPSTVAFVDAIPKNPTGKVLKRALRQS